MRCTLLPYESTQRKINKNCRVLNLHFTRINISIHSFSTIYSWSGQESNRHPSFQRHSTVHNWASQCNQDQRGQIILSVRAGSSIGSPQSNLTGETSICRRPIGILIRCLNHFSWLTPFDMEEQQLYSELLLDNGVRSSPATLLRKITSAACIQDLVVLVMIKISWP